MKEPIGIKEQVVVVLRPAPDTQEGSCSPDEA